MTETRTAVVGWVGHRVDALDGPGAAKVTGVIDKGGDDAWLLVRTGRIGRTTAVPAAAAVEGVGCVWVPYSREQIKGAPKLEARAELGANDERRLREHYGIG